MKKRSIILAAIAIIAVTTIAIVSCKKDKVNENNTADNSMMSNELSEMDYAMIAFGEKLRSASKDNATMPLEEGLNTLTNYQNFTLCNASFLSNEMIVDTVKSKLNVTNGEVSLHDLCTLYETTRTEILSKLNELSGDQKNIYLIRSVVSGGLDREDMGNLSSQLEINVIAYMYDGSSLRYVNPFNFDSTDYWYDFDSLGKCDIYAGQCVGRDCITELNSKLHIRMSWPHCPVGFRTYFSDLENDYRRSRDYPDTSSPNGHHAWPLRSGIDPADCVTPSEMTWYLLRIENDMDDLEDELNKFIVEYLLKEVYHLPWKEPNYIHETYLYYTVGNMNCTPLPND